ncbi:hypothetical protein D3C71_2047250 [compost metagenome]
MINRVNGCPIDSAVTLRMRSAAWGESVTLKSTVSVLDLSMSFNNSSILVKSMADEKPISAA